MSSWSMTFEWLDRRKSHYEPTPGDYVIRQSNVGNMTLCQGRVGEMIGRDPLPPSEAMFFGTAVHYMIDDFIAWYNDEVGGPGDEHPDIPVLEMTWQDVYAWLSRIALEHDSLDLGTKFRNNDAAKQWTHEVMFAVNTWVEQVWLTWGVSLPIEGREVQLFAPLGQVDGRGVWMSGHPDAWTRDILIDWKTSGKAWRKNKQYGMVQDDVYAELVAWNFGYDIASSTFVVYNRQKREWNFHPATITIGSRNSARIRAFEHARDLILGTFGHAPTDVFGNRPWYCSPKFCSAWDHCLARNLGGTLDSAKIEIQGRWL